MQYPFTGVDNKLGILQPNPQATLDVNGNVNVSGGLTSAKVGKSNDVGMRLIPQTNLANGATTHVLSDLANFLGTAIFFDGSGGGGVIHFTGGGNTTSSYAGTWGTSVGAVVGFNCYWNGSAFVVQNNIGSANYFGGVVFGFGLG